MTPIRHDWLDPQLSLRLCELHALSGEAQLTMRQIAGQLNKEFGTQLTKNACIGRAHRLQLEPRPAIATSRAPKQENKMPIIPVGAPIAPELPEYKRSPNGVPLLNLRMWRDCHWPYGELQDKAEWFCGEPAYGGSNWCEAHHARVYGKGRW